MRPALRVLVADDHAPTRAGVRLALEQGGCEVCAEGSLWKSLADEIAEFALAHFFDGNGLLHEFFDPDWKFTAGTAGSNSETSSKAASVSAMLL